MSATPDATRPDRTPPASTGRPVGVVRSEERLQVGKEVRVSRRAVLRKYVVTETVTQTFEVRHEEVRLEEAPLTGGDSSPRGAAFDGRTLEVVLHTEVPVVQMKVVPTERVRLHVDTVTERVPVTADLQREQLVVDVDATPPLDTSAGIADQHR